MEARTFTMKNGRKVTLRRDAISEIVEQQDKRTVVIRMIDGAFYLVQARYEEVAKWLQASTSTN